MINIAPQTITQSLRSLGEGPWIVVSEFTTHDINRKHQAKREALRGRGCVFRREDRWNRLPFFWSSSLRALPARKVRTNLEAEMLPTNYPPRVDGVALEASIVADLRHENLPQLLQWFHLVLLG